VDKEMSGGRYLKIQVKESMSRFHLHLTYSYFLSPGSLSDDLLEGNIRRIFSWGLE